MAQAFVLPNRITAHIRLILSTVLGFAAYFLLPWSDELAPMRVALSGDVGALCFLILIVLMMQRSDIASIRRRAEIADVGRVEIIVLILAAAILSLFAVATVLAGSRELALPDKIPHVAVAVVTILVSWFFIHALFATHYAHLYYDAGESETGKPTKKIKGGLKFPDEPNPDYWDFVYFSFVLGMTFQVSDVQVTARNLRHLTTAHGIIAFFYNTVVLALAVSIAANLI
jgi:uncharacterized membrane protein